MKQYDFFLSPFKSFRKTCSFKTTLIYLLNLTRTCPITCTLIFPTRKTSFERKKHTTYVPGLRIKCAQAWALTEANMLFNFFLI